MKTAKMILMSALALIATGLHPRAATLNFSGLTWVVRSSGPGGPGPNYWAPDNVSVDTNGFLHLRLTHRNDRWYCSEIYSQNRLGFGRYDFSVTGPLDKLDRNVVLGLFNYPTSDVGRDGTYEIDIEFAQWGRPSAPMGNYTVWPCSPGLRQQTKPFTFTLADNSSTHSFTWTSTNILFQSRHGLGGAEQTNPFASWLYQPTNPAAAISQKQMPIHINLWCFQGHPPSDGQEVEIVIRAFKFTPIK